MRSLLWSVSALLSGLALEQQPADEKPAAGVRLHVWGFWASIIFISAHGGLPEMLMLSGLALQLNLCSRTNATAHAQKATKSGS